MNNKLVYDKIPEGYYDTIFDKKKGIQYNWHFLKFKKVYSLIENLQPKSILDVACGPGTFLGNLNYNSHLVGIDIAEKQIQYANKKYGNKNRIFKLCKNALYPYPDESFELITAIEFIEHISEIDFDKNIREMLRCLKPGGSIILTTPNYYSLWPILEVLVSKLSNQNYIEQHISHYNKNKLLKKLNNFNFNSVEIKTYLLFAPFLGIFGNTLPYFFDLIETKIKLGPGNLLIAKILK